MDSGKSRNGTPQLFDRIAPIYDLFYSYQKSNYNTALDILFMDWPLPTYQNIIDLGCGTGALCSVLKQRGLDVTGVDLSEKMLSFARGKKENNSIKFVQANILEKTPFEDKSFDIAIASFVAHGLKAAERRLLYTEMKRLARHLVIIYDYNEKRSILVSLLEWLEGGDYFNFVKMGKQEMRKCFQSIHTIDARPQSTWYICEPGETVM